MEKLVKVLKEYIEENLAPDEEVKIWPIAVVKLQGRRTFYNLPVPEGTIGGICCDIDIWDKSMGKKEAWSGHVIVRENGEVLTEFAFGSLAEAFIKIGEISKEEVEKFKEMVEKQGIHDPVTF